MTAEFLTRAYIVRVRPFKRETTDSYSRRLLAANNETNHHREFLISLVTKSKQKATRARAWLNLLRVKAGRPNLQVEPRREDTPRHLDGANCSRCLSGVPNRHMCLLCAHGKEIEQWAHFDELVCERHRRWVGLYCGPSQQAAIGDEHVVAAHTFRKLRRQRRLDARLYRILVQAVAAGGRIDGTLAERERYAFPAAMRIADTLSSYAFIRRLLDPRTNYAQRFSLLSDAVTSSLGGQSDAATRQLWLYLRPTFAAVHRSLTLNEPYVPLFTHDLTVPTPLAERIAAAWSSTGWPIVRQIESFENYLAVTGDSLITVARSGVEHLRRPVDESYEGDICYFICEQAHQFTAKPLAFNSVHPPKAPACPICSGREVAVGINDLATFFPHIAAELDEILSCCRATELTHASSKAVAWRCPRSGHRYWATPSNRTLNGTNCPYCWGRICPGLTDLSTTHPHVALELLIDSSSRPATSLSGGSECTAQWRCASGHEYNMRVATRVTLDECPTCKKERNAATGNNIAVTHPEIAATWHPTRNGLKRPEHFSHGSREKVWWVCQYEHEYDARIERRTAGTGCSVCARRKLVPGVTDLASQEPILVKEFHPYLNGSKEPSEVFPSDKRFAWRCLRAGHVTHQTVQHRRQSRGCTDCPPEERILSELP